MTPVLLDWLERIQPTKKDRILSLMQSTRDGRLYSSKWGERQRQTGQIAEQVQRTFEVFRAKSGLDQPHRELSTAHFQVPLPKSGQLQLF